MSQSSENITKTFINELTDCLKENKFKEILNFFEDDDYNNIINEYSWDIIQIASSYLTNENVKSKKELFECCTTILNAIASKCNPSETILAFLEQVEGPEDDVKFCIILEVLGRSLSKMSNKMKAIEWCISTIRSYIESLSLPEKGAQKTLIITDKIQSVYIAIISFLEPLVDEAVLKNNRSENNAILRDYLLSGLMFLMGKPLCYFEEQQLESHLKQPLPEKIITLISHLTRDLLWFLNIIDKRSIRRYFKERIRYEESCNLKVTLFELNENMPDLAYANFYFYVVTNLHLWEKVPQVYDFHYVFQTCIYLINKLLQEQENVLIIKGLNFMDHLLKRMTKYTLTSELLELNVYTELFDTLVKVMIYCDNDKERKKALNIFHGYIEMFNMQARYVIVLRLYHTSEHSGLLSLTTGILKTSIIECLQSVPPIPYFLGNNLESLLKLACNLPHGSTSDLVELSDEIITSLNLLRFLFIRDKRNETGIWNLVDKIKNNYLIPLREGINLCKAHWKVKIKDLEEQRKAYKITDKMELEKPDTEITLTIGGEKLPVMPVTEKISFCHQAVNGLDVMESILVRVNECIVNNPFKQCIRNLWTCRTLLTDQTENATTQLNQQSNQQSNQIQNKESDEEYEKNIKAKILTASLKFVHDLGWGQQAISAGAESIGYPGVIHGLFPNQGADLVQHFYLTCNNELNKIFKEQTNAIQENPTGEKKTMESHVRDAVEIRLRMVIPYKKTWPQALALMSLPPNVPKSLANLLTLVDDICYYAGDRSVDFNWYTRRVVLAGIYKTTELYMLQDNSKDHKQTWKFLERRIKDATQIHTILTTTSNMALPEQALNRATEAASAAFTTARNILGLNWNK